MAGNEVKEERYRSKMGREYKVSFQKYTTRRQTQPEKNRLIATKKWYDPSQPRVSCHQSDISALLILLRRSIIIIALYHCHKIPSVMCCKPNICIRTPDGLIYYAQHLSLSACWGFPSIFSYQASPVNLLLWREGQ